MIRRPLPYLLLCLMLFSGGCGCQQSDFKELSSPDGRYVLIARELNCSALSPYAATITVQSRQPRLGVAWLGFPSEVVFAADVRLRQVQMTWHDDHSVNILCTGCEKYGVATKVPAWRDVRIHFDVGNAGKGVLF